MNPQKPTETKTESDRPKRNQGKSSKPKVNMRRDLLKDLQNDMGKKMQTDHRQSVTVPTFGLERTNQI